MEHSRAWWQERSKDFPAECARLIESRIGGASIEAIFLCGSFAAGDETVVLAERPVVLLSDVDLVVIVKGLYDLRAWSGRRAELGRACEALMPEVRFIGRVDVGVMLPADLARLPARPGVYDMRARGIVLAGNTGILDLIQPYVPSDISVREALTLLENRGIMLLDARPERNSAGGENRYARLYAIARAYTDIATASLSIAGSYVPGYEARSGLIRGETSRDASGILAKLVPFPLLLEVERWTRFKLEPALEASLVRSEAAKIQRLWETAARDVLFLWRQARSHARRPDGDVSMPLPFGALAGKTRRYRDWRNHLRGWRAYMTRLSPARRAVLAAALGRDLISRDPLDAVREEGLRLLDHRLTAGADAPVRGGRGGFPHHGGTWNRSAEALCTLWNDLVFGRADG